VARRAVPALLAFCALVADLAGAHEFALVLLFVAIPAGFALVVVCYGETVEARAGLGRAVLAGVGLFLLVLSAAVRSPAVVGGVPRIAITAVAIAPFPCLYAALRGVRARRVVPEVVVSQELDDLADAA
jgi:hypothetical protein